MEAVVHEPDVVFGDQLRLYRVRAGLTQEALAERAGLAAATIGALERGDRRLPYPYTRRRLSEALGLSAAEQAGFLDPRPALSERTLGSNLPIQHTPLLGRAHELAAIRALLLAEGADRARLVTLTGAGGCGKTRLALQTATELKAAFPGGAWLVELAPETDPALIPQTVATALGAEEVAGVPLLTTLLARLKPRPLLIVLDNCEHVVEACAALVAQLLAACPNLRILATSREPLQIAGEQQWRLPPLPAPELDDRVSLAQLAEYAAVQLFVARARAVVAGFELTEANAATVGQICARLDGLPLAIELAAVRVRVLGVGQILERLDDAIRLLSGGSRAVASRQQTLQAALDWSYALLSQPEQTLFRRLAVFRGGFELKAVEVVAGDAVLDLLTQLVDKSLVQAESSDTRHRATEGSWPQASPDARYRLLEPVRQYAALQLAASGETGALRARHTSHYLALAEQAATKLRGPAQATWLDRLDADRANLRAALSWAEECGEAETGLRLAVALTSFWEGRGHLGEGRRWFAGLRDPAPAAAVPASLRLAALLGAGRLAHWHGDLDESAALFTRCLAIAREQEDRQAMADALTWLAAVRRRQGATSEAAALLEESLPTYRALGDEPGTAWTLFNLAMVSESVPRAIPLLEEALRRYRALGDVRFIAFASAMLAGALTSAGERTRVPGLLLEALARFQEVGDQMFLLSGLLTLALVAAQLGQPELAARLLGATEAHRGILGASLVPVNQRTQDSALAEIGARLGEAEIAEAWAAGRALNLEQLIAEAMTVGTGAATPEPHAVAASTSHTHDRLTSREREVALLVDQGASDREIAAALGISVRTAGVHVQHVLAKLGLRSRWQVAGLMETEGGRPK